VNEDEEFADGAAPLAGIPFFDVGRDGPVALTELAADRVKELARHAGRRYPSALQRIGDRASRQWLHRSRNPYRHEIAAVARRTKVPGAIFLNLSYEWGCTTGVGRDPCGHGNRMLRTLDWPLDGIGRHVVVAAQDGGAGLYYNVTWPGFVGVLTAMAPQRFCAAINQPPLLRFTASCRLDWAINRGRMWRRTGLPPSHLLRRVFDSCNTFEEARASLVNTPLCLPAFFVLSGARTGQACVIERLEHTAAVHDAPASISNHWLALDVASHDRGMDTRRRRACMEAGRDAAPDGFSWVLPPILNWKTRLAVVANAGREVLLVRGFEDGRPATRDFALRQFPPAGTTGTRQGREAAIPA
jgi:hypothetical protein